MDSTLPFIKLICNYYDDTICSDQSGNFIFDSLFIEDRISYEDPYGIYGLGEATFLSYYNDSIFINISEIPTFQLSTCTVMDTIIGSNNYIKLSIEVATIDTQNRMIAIYAGFQSYVSNKENALLHYSLSIASNAKEQYTIIPFDDFYDALNDLNELGISLDSTIYFTIYPAAYKYTISSFMAASIYQFNAVGQGFVTTSFKLY